MNPLLLELTSFDEEEGAEFLKILDNDILYELENLCVYYKDNISSTALRDCLKDPNWEIMNKVLDMMFFLLVDEKFIIWYEEYMEVFCGAYIHKKDGSEQYYYTFIWNNMDFSKEPIYYYLYFSKITLQEIFKNIENYKYIHIYTKAARNFVYFDFHAIPVIVTIKHSIYDLNIFTEKGWITDKVENYVRIKYPSKKYKDCFNPDVVFDIKCYNNNKQYKNPSMVQILDTEKVFENATGYIPLVSLQFTDMAILDISKYRYLEYSYFNLDTIPRRALAQSTVYFLNGAVRAVWGHVYSSKYTEEKKQFGRSIKQCYQFIYDNEEKDKTHIDDTFHDFITIDLPSIKKLHNYCNWTRSIIAST